MPSHGNLLPAGKTHTRWARDLLRVWNRKGHYYLGLYFLFFLWLFAFTGLLLNHSWQFAEFWPNRTVSKFERPISLSKVGSDLERARDVMGQLGITGEVEWTTARPESSTFQFRVNRPGRNLSVVADPDLGRATVEQIDINTWGVMRVLHTFSGVRAGDARNQRDWMLTTLWVFTMDAVSAGLIFMVLSGLYMWYGLPGKRKPGVAVLLCGTVVCGVFVFGLRWIYA
jgi:hypothetical protein